MMRDIDMINVCAADMELLARKCNLYASQVQDPAIRNLLQDAARMHQQHVAALATVRGQIQAQLGAPQPSPQQLMAGGQGGAAGQPQPAFAGQTATARWGQS